jgi:hypothetical protein
MSGEEAYVLRFEDAAVADRVRAVLRGAADANPADAAMELDFDGEKGRAGREGARREQARQRAGKRGRHTTSPPHSQKHGSSTATRATAPSP